MTDDNFRSSPLAEDSAFVTCGYCVEFEYPFNSGVKKVFLGEKEIVKFQRQNDIHVPLSIYMVEILRRKVIKHTSKALSHRLL